MTIYRCEDTAESVYTAVYQAYEERRDPADTLLCLTEEPFLFAEDIVVRADAGKTRKVLDTLCRRFGRENSLQLNMALASGDAWKAQAVYRTITEGLKNRCRPGHLFDNLAQDEIHKAFALGRSVSREVWHQMDFLRFQKLDNGVLFSRIGPKYDVLAFLMPHFADRLPIEHFLIYDEKRNLFGVHPARRDWYLLRGEEAQMSLRLQYSEEEPHFQELFRQFCHTIMIEERRNRKLQLSMLPLRFREYMVEHLQS